MQAMYNHGVCEWKVTNYASGVPERKEQYGPNSSTIVTAWYEDSLPRMKEEYRDECLLNGEYMTPEQEEESSVSDGAGIRIVRDGHGALLSKQRIQDGTLVEETRYYPNGMPQAVLPYRGGNIEGIVKTYQITGEPKSIEAWQEGTPNGETTLFSNGEATATLSYIDGVKEGIEKRYKPGTDEVVETISWKRGMRYGPTIRFIDNQKITEWYYKNDKVSKMQFIELEANK
jgi:antitoxin component YwqK of YwqJK toxin-antitoxin module